MASIDIQKLQNEKPILELLEFSIINLDKPVNQASSDVVANVKNILAVKKAGHFGTLDPIVCGVLPISLNKACKLSDFFMHQDKEYVGEMKLHKEISQTALKEEMKKFLGEITQKPPVKSSVKRIQRKRVVNKFELLELKGKNAKFNCDVQAGTYIRKLVHDLGKDIGGAQMISLRRTRAGIFLEKNSYTVKQVLEAFNLFKEKGDESKLREILIPAEIISKIYPQVQCDKALLIEKLLNGKPIYSNELKDNLPDSDIFCLFNNNLFIGMYNKEISPTSEIIARPLYIRN